MLCILVAWSGLHGQRILGQLRTLKPRDWQVLDYRFPAAVEDASVRLPERVDLVIGLVAGLEQAEMVPGLCERVHAGAAIIPVDRHDWLPEERVRHLRARFREMGIPAVFPHPFCSLTETDYNYQGRYVAYDGPAIEEFALYFGAPRFDLAIWNREIVHASVQRAAPCGCAAFVARGIRGMSVDEAGEQAARLLKRYPCYGAPALVGHDPAGGRVYRDPVSEAIEEAVEPYKRARTFSPR